MAAVEPVKGKKVFSNGTIQYTIKKAGLLDKPIYLTFDDEAKGDAYVRAVKAMLDKGVIPSGLKDHRRGERPVMTVADLVREYGGESNPSSKDRSALNPTVKAHGALSLSGLNAAWVDAWISGMKRMENLAPASIRARVGAMARCTDWGVRKGHLVMPDHPFRTLPDGYATYTRMDEKFAGKKREDVERDRRLEPGEYEKILGVIDAGVLPRSQRPLMLEHAAALRCIFILAVETAMRLREMFTLTLEQVDLKRRTVFLDKTKNGDKRQVPLSSVAVTVLEEYLKVRDIPSSHPKNMVFPWWNGDTTKRILDRVTDSISKQFVNTRSAGIFSVAGCEELHFHDLRHEATSRLYEKSSLSDMQIAKVTGHRSLRMLARYANLRGSDLAARLW